MEKVIQEAELKLQATRAERCWASRRGDWELEKLLRDESYKCWVGLELLKSRGRAAT